MKIQSVGRPVCTRITPLLIKAKTKRKRAQMIYLQHTFTPTKECGTLVAAVGNDAANETALVARNINRPPYLPSF